MDRPPADMSQCDAASTHESFEDWVRARSPHLRRLAFLLTGNLDQAEDLLQAAYAKLLPRWSRISTYDSPEGYTYRVMVNLRTSWWRRARNREYPTDEIPETHRLAVAPDEVHNVVESQVLLAALRGLPPRQRAAVVLRHWCDLSEAETAAIMNCSLGSVKSNASRGVARLREALTETENLSDAREGSR